jgi:hypothetical protein
MNINNDKKGLKWLIYLIFGGFLIQFFHYIFKGNNEKKIARNFKDFFGKEKKEAEELAAGKESLERYIKDSCSIFRNYFIPSECNNFKPRVLRTKSLAIIAIALLILKASVTGYLFFIYPNLAKMSALMQDEVQDLINIERAGSGEPALNVNEILNKVAKAKADDMIKNSYFAHKSLDGKMIWDTINRSEYPYLYVGENLAMNFTSAQSAHKALMLSPTHKKNILNDKYTEIGIAVASGEINGKNTNVLVQVFGHAKTVKPAVAKTEAPVAPKPAAPKTVEKNIEKPIPVEKPIQPETQIKNKPEPVVAGENNQNIPKKPTEVLSAEIKPAENLNNSLNNPEASEEEVLAEEQQQEMENNILATAKEINIEVSNDFGTAARAINYSQYIFIISLISLVILLLVNIFVRISIQHKPVIVQTVVVILFVYGLMSVKFHFLESVVEKILVM